MMRLCTLGLTLLAVTPGGTEAQARVGVRTAVLFESYSLGTGLGFDRVSELSFPVGVTVGLGRVGSLALSSGFASVSVSGEGSGEDLSLSGALDTDIRLNIDLIPGRLVALGTASLPTGKSQVEFTDLPLLGVIASDLIGFASPTFGAGGNVGGGFVAAVPAGRMALGLGATFRRPMAYQPIADDPSELRPGAEFRLRAGLEGPLGPRTYLRVAGVFARRDNDERDATELNRVGNRWIAYSAINQGVGSASVTLYVYDVFRGSPQIEQTATGSATLPRGNLLATGLQAAVASNPDLSFTPRFEYRLSHAASPLDPEGSVEKLGSSARFGLDVRRRLGEGVAIVLQGSGLVGSIQSNALTGGGASVDLDLSGYRVALHLEVRR